MLTSSAIAALIPHQGEMCLLESAETWTAENIVCRASSHLSPSNPLRRAGRLGILCGCEYAFQAAALHGALLADGTKQAPGYVAALRVALIDRPFLDDPEIGMLHVEAVLEAGDASGMIYQFRLQSEAGTPLLEGRATIRIAP